MTPELSQNITQIEGLRDLHLQLLMRMLHADGGKVFSLDLLATAVIKRSLSLCEGFATLVRSSNYTASAALLRLQLDSCLRIYGAFIVEDPHKFARDVLQGIPIRKIKDQKGQLMTDRYLVEALGAKYKWMPRVYTATSGFIHLSERHIFATWEPLDGDNNMSIIVGPTDEHFAEELWIEMASAFLATTDVLFEHLRGWVATKENSKRAAGKPTA